jgi:ArsR family transcriptional regulator, virulence genes transcriptional regulator
MEREREEQLYRLQADLCRVLAEPTRLKLLSLLGERPCAVKDLVEATGERQTKISQHLSIMRQRGMVHVQRAGTEMHYSLADPRILEACRITREVLLQQLTQQASLATPHIIDEKSRRCPLVSERPSHSSEVAPDVLDEYP